MVGLELETFVLVEASGVESAKNHSAFRKMVAESESGVENSETVEDFAGTSVPTHHQVNHPEPKFGPCPCPNDSFLLSPEVELYFLFSKTL